jgi:hypothetical protein
MEAQDFQFEECVIAVGIGLALHELDLGIGALQRARGDRILVVVQDPLTPERQGFFG